MSVKIDFDLSEFSSKKLWSNDEKWSTLVTLNDSKLGLDSFALPETIFDTFLGGV